MQKNLTSSRRGIRPRRKLMESLRMAMGSFMTHPTLLVLTGPAMDFTTLLTWKQVTVLSTFRSSILLYEDHATQPITEI